MNTRTQSLASKLFFACLFLVAVSHNVLAQETPILMIDEEVVCRQKNSCSDCLEIGYCDWYGSICSHNTLVIADVARYSVDSESTIEQVCERATLDRQDRDLCDTKTDCASCTETILSDNVNSCTWYPEFGFCGSELCGMIGCGLSTCEDPNTTTEILVETTETETETETNMSENASAANSNKCIGIAIFAILSVALAL